MEQGQASDGIEITPAMLRAGVYAQFDYILEETDSELIARAIYTAMEAERRRSLG